MVTATNLPLPEITLDHVQIEDEEWDFGSRAGIAVSVVLGDEIVIRYGRSYPTYEVVQPPKYDTREVVFEIRDDPLDPEAVRYVTQEVRVLIDSGKTREFSIEETSQARQQAIDMEIERLRYVTLAGQLLQTQPPPVGLKFWRTALDLSLLNKAISLIRAKVEICESLPHDGAQLNQHVTEMLRGLLTEVEALKP